ncbi:MAG: hypothetical protein ACYTBZ_12195, partial [Planctomycetota bacterium]
MKSRTREFVTHLASIIILSVTTNLPADPLGLLVVHPTNGRYFMEQGDPEQKTVYLTGSHTWNEFQDYEGDIPFDYTRWLNDLTEWGHNFFRGWHWEDDYYSPWPYEKAGNGKYNLNSYNPAYFDLLKTRIEQAANHNPPFYLSIMLFEGWSIEDKGGSRVPDPWPRHPYKLSNNNNGINGDPNGNGEGVETHTLDIPAVTALQEDYIEHTIDELNGYDNIIWEIVNETGGTDAWQFHMVDHIQNYEASKPKQHLVWVNVIQSSMFHADNHAEVVSPRSASIYRTDPPHATGAKVIISDSDHIGPSQATYPWIWKAITRGQHPVFMDGYLYHLSWYDGTYNPNDPKNPRMRDAMGITL